MTERLAALNAGNNHRDRQSRIGERAGNPSWQRFRCRVAATARLPITFRQGGRAMTGLSTPESAAGDSRCQSNVDREPPASKRTSFDGVSVAFHWLTVVLVLSLITTAVWALQSHDDVLRVLLLRIHRSLGVTVWFTTVSRLIWRMTHAQLPPFPDHMTQTHRSVVQLSEYGLYVLLVIQPLTGFSAMLTRGRSFTLFWGHVPPLIPHFPSIEAALFLLHRIGAWSFILLITGHAVHALVRHFIVRDNTLGRMAPVLGAGASMRQLSLGSVDS
jgi:cytochrome b561